MSWDDDDYYSSGDDITPPPIPKKSDLCYNQIYCYHDWKATVLIISTVYDCCKCGVKKEDFEKWKSQNS